MQILPIFGRDGSASRTDTILKRIFRYAIYGKQEITFQHYKKNIYEDTDIVYMKQRYILKIRHQDQKRERLNFL